MTLHERIPAEPVRGTTLLRKVVTILLAVFFLSAAIHIMAVLLVPRLASSDGWSRAAALAEPGHFLTIPNNPDSALMPGLDPMFLHAVCALSIEEAPGVLSLTASDRFWSLALYNDKGIVVFSLNDRTAQDGTLAMLVVNPVQSALLKQNPPDDIDDLIVVNVEDDDLLAVFRLYAPNAELRRSAQLAIDAAICEPDF